MLDRTYYVICEDKCLFEAMTKEQIIAAIAEATGSTPTDVDSAFITKIKEQNANRELKFWVGTQAQYNAIAEPAEDTFYLITNPTFESDIQVEIAELQTQVAENKTELETEVSNLTTEINALKEKKPIDISSSIELSTESTDVEVDLWQYVYDPASKIVHFVVNVSIKNAIAASTSIRINHTGGYIPKRASTAVTAHSYDRAERATYNANLGGEPYIYVVNRTESITAGGMWISGFYFCEGE